MIRICKEESFHQRQGYEIVMKLAQGSPEQKAMAQESLDRFWQPVLMMFGPPDSESQNTDHSTRWKIKRFTNDELRQKFVDATVPQAEFLGLTVPDADLKWNKDKQGYDFGPIDWDEFWRVVKGKGPMNRQRVEARQKAWDMAPGCAKRRWYTPKNAAPWLQNKSQRTTGRPVSYTHLTLPTNRGV